MLTTWNFNWKAYFQKYLLSPCNTLWRGYTVLLPNALCKSILLIFRLLHDNLQLLSKQATAKTVDHSTVHCWLIMWQMTSRKVKCPDVNDEHWRASAYCLQCFSDLNQLDNKTVISRLLGEHSNHCPSVVKKTWETVALGLQPLATVSQIFSTTSGQ